MKKLQIDPAVTAQNGNAKVSSVSIDPSVLFLFKHEPASIGAGILLGIGF